MDMIVKTDGICGGSARISTCRIPVWSIIDILFNHNFTQEILCEIYPQITPDDCADAIKYYSENKTEIDKEILEARLEGTNDID